MAETDRRLLKQLPEKMKAVAVHWALVDAVLPAGDPLRVLNGVDRAAFDAMGVRLEELKAALQARQQEEKLALAAHRDRKAALHERFNWFSRMTRGYYAGTVWAEVLPLAPSLSDGYDAYLTPMREGMWLWLRMNAEMPPPVPGAELVAPDGYTTADFAHDVQALVESWMATWDADFEVRLARGCLRHHEERLLVVVAAYGHAARGRLGKNHDLMRLLPTAWPKRAKVAADDEVAGEEAEKVEG